MPTGIYPRIKPNTGMFIKGKNSGENHQQWKGGKTIDKRGYIHLYSPNHPYHDSGKYVMEHRLVMEKSIGRFLEPAEIVHHVNGILSDNRLENLMLFANQAEHIHFHTVSGNPLSKKGRAKPINSYSFPKGHPKPKNAHSWSKGHPYYPRIKHQKTNPSSELHLS